MKISVKRKNESVTRFVPRDKPAMPLMDAVELAMVRHRDALEYLRDK